MAFKNACHPWIVVGFWGSPEKGQNFLDHNNSPKGAHWEDFIRWYKPSEATFLKMKEENLSLETVWKRQKTDEEERKVSAAKKPLVGRDSKVFTSAAFKQEKRSWMKDTKTKRGQHIPYISVEVGVNFQSTSIHCAAKDWSRPVVNSYSTLSNIISP